MRLIFFVNATLRQTCAMLSTRITSLRCVLFFVKQLLRRRECDRRMNHRLGETGKGIRDLLLTLRAQVNDCVNLESVKYVLCL